MKDRFRGKTWIYWAQLIVCGIIGLCNVILGILFWTRAMADVRGVARPEVGPPAIIGGCCLLAVATLAAFNIIGRVTPIIRCYCDGIECNLVGASSLDGVPLVPGLVRVAWTILSLQGFRSQRVRITWPHFAGAFVSGIPMAKVLTLNGAVMNLKTGRVTEWVAFRQAELKDDPKQVADVLNHFAAEPTRRDELAHWPVDSLTSADKVGRAAT